MMVVNRPMRAAAARLPRGSTVRALRGSLRCGHERDGSRLILVELFGRQNPWESRPKEFHLRPLAEQCVTLSRYTAPTKCPIPLLISSEMSVALKGLLRNATT